MSERLDDLRTQIDAVDQQLVALLAQRKHLVAAVGETKSQLGLPIYVPERESKLIQARRAEAEAHGVSPNLIEDVLRRVMRESYAAEGDTGFKPTAPDLGPIVIVGGRGGMGSLFAQLFRNSTYTVRILDTPDWPNAAELLAGAALVVVSVPIHLTCQVIEQLGPFLEPSTTLADLTSIKAAPLRKMLEVHTGPVVGLHPMFGPTTHSLAKQLILYSHGRKEASYHWLLDQFQIWGAGLLQTPPEKHDHMMGTIQAMRHFATYTYGVHLFREGIDLDTLLAFSSPIYRLELAMVGRLFAQDPDLYADIIFSSVEGREIAERFHRRFDHELQLLRDGDRDQFRTRFLEVRAWFGKFADQFLQESTYMLEKVYEKFGDRPTQQPTEP